MATGPLTRVISGLAGVHDLDDPALARLTREARYETLTGLAAANLRTGRPVVLVAPWVWLHPTPDELARRLTRPTPLRSLQPQTTHQHQCSVEGNRQDMGRGTRIGQ